MTELRAYQNCELTKAELVARMQAHYDADEILKGATGDSGKGCTVWCALDRYDHEAFPPTLGLPVWLAKLLDQIFESLPQEEARQFSQDWPKAIEEGADLSLVRHRFLNALLVDPEHGVIQYAPGSPEILKVAELRQRVIDGGLVTEDEWAAARDAAWAARRAAADEWAAESAADAAWAAARAAANEARAAARDAAWAARRAAANEADEVAAVAAAWAAAWAWQRDVLLDLLRSAPVSPTAPSEVVASAIGRIK